MDSPDSPSSPFTGGDSTRIRATSLVESFSSWALSGIRIGREDLRRRIEIPEYLRFAMRDSIHYKDPYAGQGYSWDGKSDAPEAPMVVFVNSKSGGRLGAILKGRLQELMGEDQVFDISVVKPPDFVHYALNCLENMGDDGDYCAHLTREKLRVVVAGGDGTVGWVLGSLQDLYHENRDPVPPTAIIPLGTGNDLSRSFGWGGTFPFAWKAAIKKSLYKAITGPLRLLDSWHVTVSMPSGEVLELPYSLRLTEECTLAQELHPEINFLDKPTCFEGVFYNYYSIGMDAQVAYGFHHLRDDKPYLAQGPIANKLIYSGYSCTQGWFCTPFVSDPCLRGLKNILRVHIKKIDCSEWEEIRVPSSVRAIVALNLHHYGSGRNPWGNPRPDYMEKRGFVEAHADDGLLEIFGLKQGWHASFVMVEIISAKHIAQAAAIRFEIRGGEWKQAFMQMDGEPWKQPLDTESSTYVEIKRVPHQSIMISGE